MLLKEASYQSNNSNRIKFSILWANHDRYDGFPEPCSGPLRLLYSTDYSYESLYKLFSYWIDNYFSHSSYWRLPDGRLFLSIHLPSELIERAGGELGCRKIIEMLRKMVFKSSLAEIHLNTTQGHYFGDVNKLKDLGFDSVTNYCVLGYRESKEDPIIEELNFPDYSHLQHLPYSGRTENVVKTWNYILQKSGLAYYPVVTVGRDCSPRVEGPAASEYMGRYGNRPVLDDAKPEYFRDELEAAFKFVVQNRNKQVPIIFINSWNEWAEGAYLEPDSKFKYGHLSVVKEIAHRFIETI